jgi:hypothetical protein
MNIYLFLVSSKFLKKYSKARSFHDHIAAYDPFKSSCNGPPPVNNLVPESSYERA